MLWGGVHGRSGGVRWRSGGVRWRSRGCAAVHAPPATLAPANPHLRDGPPPRLRHRAPARHARPTATVTRPT
ncbi:hypothetical protein GCM10010469_14910 [Streptomyces labedae]|uniref:Uncharacterized protein n=1 Tax=Streptomyces labedae TaxID=285569 RepID=A0ABP6QUM9_9ACTN